MQIICIDKNPFISFYYKLYLEQKYKVNVKTITSYEEISAPELKKCKYLIFLNNYQKKSFYFFINKKQEMKLDYKIINIYNKKIDFLPKKYKENSISLFDLKNINSLIKSDDLLEEKFKPYYTIPYEMTTLMKSMPCNIYKKTGIYYDSITTRSNKLNLNEFRNKQLYIQHSSLNTFSKEFMGRTYQEYKGLKDHGNLLKFIAINYKKIKDSGLSSNDIDLIDQKLDFVFSIVNENNEGLFQLMSKIYSKDFFIAEHSLMLTYLTAKMGSIFFQEENKTNNLIFSSLFHDLKLEIKDQEKELSLDIGKERLEYHCTEIIQSLRDLDFFNNEIEDVLLFHHELPNGQGLFHKENYEISASTSIFIVAHFYINQLYKNNMNRSKAIENTLSFFKESGQPYEQSVNLLNQVINI